MRIITTILALAISAAAGLATAQVNNPNKQKPNRTHPSNPGTTLNSNSTITEIQIVEEPEQVFQLVDQMPVFPGGDAALLQFISTHIIYPQEAAENGIQGRVVVRFVVKKDGSIGDIEVARSKDPQLDAEAVRIVRILPRFSPGYHEGRPVNVWYTLPVTFRLTE